MEGDQKEVFYDQYCNQCKYKDTADWEDPCDECLATPSNTDSHKPVYFEEK